MAAEPDPEPVADAGPRTVGRFIADALRAAGVRYAFTVPGESFLGLLDAFEGAGIRVVATRHEGAAAFMAEAHGQLTGRPAICLGTRAVGGANLAIGIHTARQDSTPMFVAVGQVERAYRGREAFQEIDQVESLGRLAKWAAEPRTAADVVSAMTEATRQALTGRPGPVLLSLPEDLLDEVMPEDAVVDTGRPGAARATDDEIRAVIEFLASAERPVILAGGGILRARTSTELTRFAELLQVPVIAAWRRADVISNDHPLFLGHGRIRRRLVGPRAAGRCRCAARPRFAAERADDLRATRSREPASAGHMSTSSRAQRADRRRRTFTVAADAKAFLKAANERLLGRAVLDAALVATRQANNARRSGRLRGGVHRGRDAVGRTRRPSRADHRDASPGPARRRDPDHRRRQLRELGGSWLPLPPSGHLPRPDLGRDGLRPARRDRRRARPSRPARRRARRRRRPRDDDGRARDGRPGRRAGRRRRLRQRALRHDPDVAGATRDGGRRRERARARSISRPWPGPAAPGAFGSSTTPTSSPRCGPRSWPTGPTVIQLALDRAWVSIDQTPG